MANISGSTSEKIFQLKQWGGLNEAPDGDAKLKLGEASVMTNWKVTRDGNLKRRPGSELVCGCRPVYEAVVHDEEGVEPTLVTTTDSITVFEDIAPDTAGDMSGHGRPGYLYLFGDSATIDSGSALAHAGEYFTSGGKFWRLSSAALNGNDETEWYGYRVKAEPTGSLVKPVAGMWTGWLNNEEIMLVACDGVVYQIFPGLTNNRVAIGALDTSSGVHMFGFEGKVYFLNGVSYYQYDGVVFEAVAGYRPLVAIAVSPNGENELLEAVNLLCGERRVWISPDGETDDDDDELVTGRTFPLPEKNIASVDYVTDLATGEELPPSEYVYNLTAGTVTFSTAPMQSTNSYEIGYTMGVTYRSQVEHMHFSELYSGTQDTRIFLYGDGTNQCIYSGLDYYGAPRADYFPDLNACAIGDSNTPITAMIRHYSTLVCFKRSSAWSLTYGVMALTNDSLAPAFYATPVNRRLGNEPLGQVVLVDNSPVTLTTGEVYQWQNSSYYSSNLTQDERQAKRISDRIQSSIKELPLAECMCYDDNYGQEYYICHDGTALVWNYAANAWYKYEDFDAVAMCNYGGELYYGTSDGKIMHLTYEVPDNDLEPIEAYWESGAMDFGQDYMRKYSAMLWVGIKPDDETEVTVTVRTDRKEEYNEKIVSSERARVEGEPYMRRSKIKAKKFTHYTLIFKSDGEGNAPTVNSADIRVRFTGYAKG